jgi:pimeloyl-ACP methyl ester carboxylesterase
MEPGGTSSFVVKTDLASLYVESTGAGPAILCWPSLFCDGRTMRSQVDALSIDHRVLVVDGPGHGRSGSPRQPFSLEECADAAVRVLDAAGIGRAVFVGSAWGGHVGVVAALRVPDRLRALVVMNAPMKAWSGLVRVKFWTLLQLFRFLGPSDFLVRAVTEAQLCSSVRLAAPERAATIANCIRSSERHGFFVAIRSGMLGRQSLVSRLPDVRIPTLFLTGALDELFSVEEARSQAAMIPGSRFGVIAGTAHQSAYEAPELVNPLLRGFLQALPPEHA